MNRFAGSSKQQFGVALFMALIMLLAISILAVTGIRTTTMQERMAASLQEHIRLFQNSENRLEDTYVATLGMNPNNPSVAINAQINNGITSNGSSSYTNKSLAVGYSDFVYLHYSANVDSWIDLNNNTAIDADESLAAHSQGIAVLVPTQ